jgi:hypothetical protein
VAILKRLSFVEHVMAEAGEQQHMSGNLEKAKLCEACNGNREEMVKRNM